MLHIHGIVVPRLLLNKLPKAVEQFTHRSTGMLQRKNNRIIVRPSKLRQQKHTLN